MMLARAAHDFASTLTAIGAAIALAERQLDSAHPARAPLADIKMAADNGGQLAGMLMRYATDKPEPKAAVDLARFVREQGNLLRPFAGAEIAFETNIASGEPLIAPIEPAALQLALMNLVHNASQAIGERPGRIELGLSDRREPGQESRAVLSVDDSGPGIEASMRERIFEPFVTSRPGEGCGLGLEIVRTTATRLGGTIALSESHLGGARFELAIPLAGDGLSSGGGA